ncbi:MAG: Gfo/Idh/MocA family oxidoreductase [Melioribacteraceae bacterium]|nr:Gfo/Idh/MocA family oxidoreductase [Melioribacteraceae bacterium]
MIKTRVGIIGLGGIAQLVHLPIVTKMNTVEVVAVAEVNKNRLKTVSEKFQIKNRYLDYNEMIEKNELDAVIIATPTNTHHRISIDCLKNGLNLLVEKPVATSLNETKEICDAAKKYNKIVMVGMNARFRPDAMLLKSLLTTGELGEIFYVRTGWARKQSSTQNWFLKKEVSGGGAILDLGIVLLDMSLWLLDFPALKSVSVQKFHHKVKGVEDSAVGFVRFKNNSVLNFEVSWSFHSDKDSFSLTAFGTEGTAQLNPLKAYKKTDTGNIDYTPTSTSNLKNLYKKSYENELKHFISSIRTKSPVISSCYDAMKRMELIELIYKSAELNKELILE